MKNAQKRMVKKKAFGRMVMLAVCLALVISMFPACSPVKAKEVLTGKTAMEITSEMGIGWNLGNTFDATGGNRANVYSQETSWGNPKVTRELIEAVHNRGFKTIRIPVTWNNQLSKDGKYTINPDFLARVKEVVDYAYDLDMYIIINLHHEAWLNTSKLSTNYVGIGEQLEAVWSQIAEYFADYDQHLIFEGMNEPRLAGTNLEWTGNQEAYKAVNYLNQVFAYTVRSNGKGYNGERCLMIPGYAASSSRSILETIAIPSYEGKAVNNVIISAHCYNPYSFCLSDELREFDPANKNHTTSIDTVFQDLEELFLFNDIPVVIGETSATEKNNTDQRENWAEYMGRKAYEYGIPIIIWDNGANGHSGGECHAWILRNSCEWNYPSVVDKLFSASQYIDWGERSTIDKLAYESSAMGTGMLGGDVIWADEDGHVVAGLAFSHAQPITISVIRYYIKTTSELAIAYKGETEPRIMVWLSEKDLASGDIAPDRIEERDGYKVAFFTYRTVNDSLTAAGIRNTDNSTMYVYTEGPDTTVYEVDVVALKPEVTYFVGGQSFSSKESVTTLNGLKVLGWYTTRDFKEGTRLDDRVGKSTTLYGMAFWEKDAVAMAEYTELQKDAQANVTPTATPKPTATPVPTKEPDDSGSGKEGDVATPTVTEVGNSGGNENGNGEDVQNEDGNKDSGSQTGSSEDSSGIFFGILISLLIACLASAVVVIVVLTSKKKGKDDRKDEE